MAIMMIQEKSSGTGNLPVQRRRICAVVGKLLELGHHARTVLLVGHAEPAGRSGNHLAGSLAGLDHAVNGIRDVILLLELASVLGEELPENRLALREIVRGESPHIHGTQRIGYKLNVLFAIDRIVAIDLSVSLACDIEMLRDVVQVPVVIVETDAA